LHEILKACLLVIVNKGAVVIYEYFGTCFRNRIATYRHRHAHYSTKYDKIILLILADQKEMAEVVEDNNDSKLLEPVDDATNDEEGTVLYVSNLTRY
jgi:hypothetical protein